MAPPPCTILPTMASTSDTSPSDPSPSSSSSSSTSTSVRSACNCVRQLLNLGSGGPTEFRILVSYLCVKGGSIRRQTACVFGTCVARDPNSVNMAHTWWTRQLLNLGFGSPTEFRILVSYLCVKGGSIRQQTACVFGTCVARDPNSVNTAKTWWTRQLLNLGFGGPTEFPIVVSYMCVKGESIRQETACVFGTCVARDPNSVNMAHTWWTEELPNLAFSSPTEFRILVSGLRVKGGTIRNPTFGTFVALTSNKVNYAQTLWSPHELPTDATNLHRGSVITTKSLLSLKSKADDCGFL